MKVSYKMTNIAMDMILQLLNEASKYANFPKTSTRPKNIYVRLVWDTSQSTLVKMIVHYFGNRTKICSCVPFAKIVVGLKRRLHMGRRFGIKFCVIFSLLVD